MLAAKLASCWNMIVEKECHMTRWIGKGGVENTTKQGKTFDGPVTSPRGWLSGPCKVNVAERFFKHSSTQMHMPQRAITMEQFIKHLHIMNNCIHCLPMLKDVEECPGAVHCADVPFAEPEMCEIVPPVTPHAPASADCMEQKPHVVSMGGACL